MKNLKARLGTAAGENARLCFLALEEIKRLEKIIRELEEEFNLNGKKLK